MKDGIKEILDYLRKYIDNEETGEIIESKHTMNLLLDYITNLQEENEYSNYCNKELRKKITNLEYKIERLEENNKNLKELCDKYEEEHNNAFKLWTMKMEEMPDYEERMNYKSRNEKIINKISLYRMDDITMETNRILDDLLNTARGVDKE